MDPKKTNRPKDDVPVIDADGEVLLPEEPVPEIDDEDALLEEFGL